MVQMHYLLLILAENIIARHLVKDVFWQPCNLGESVCLSLFAHCCVYFNLSKYYGVVIRVLLFQPLNPASQTLTCYIRNRWEILKNWF